MIVSLFLFNFHLKSMSVCLCLCLRTRWAQCPRRPDEGVEFPRTRVGYGGCESPCGCWKLNQGKRSLSPNCWGISPFPRQVLFCFLRCFRWKGQRGISVPLVRLPALRSLAVPRRVPRRDLLSTGSCCPSSGGSVLTLVLQFLTVCAP